MDMLEIGFYSAVIAYGLIFAWTVLMRLRWLPMVLVRQMHWPLDRLGCIPFLGRVVMACRRYALSLGLLVAVLVGAAVPYVVLSLFWGFQTALIIGAAWIGLRYGGCIDDESEESPQAHKLYYSIYGGGRIVPGYDVEADSNHPYLGG